LLCALGVLYLFILVTLFIPSLGFIKPKGVKVPNPGRYARFIKKISDSFARLACVDARNYIALTVVLVCLAVIFIFKGKLIVGSKPLEYIRGTLPYEAAKFLNKEGRSGFAPLSVFVESTAEAGIYDPKFVERVSAFQKQLYQLGARKVFSVVDLVQKLSRQLYEKEMPSSKGEVEDIFFYLEDGTYPEVRYQTWTGKGVRVLAFIEMENSIQVGKFNESVVALGEKYPDLKVFPFGDAALYPRENKYIRIGKPRNAGWSEIVVVVFCMLLIMQKSRKLRQKRLSPALGGFVMSLPFIFASAVTFLLMMALKIPLDVATAMITALAINASIDFSIYYVDAYQEALARADKDKAILIAMREKGEIIINDILLNSLCFLPLVFSRFIPISRLGWMMVVMIAACGFGSLVIMASVLRYAVDRTSQVESSH
jgi:predicted RND superfamily exporter protein